MKKYIFCLLLLLCSSNINAAQNFVVDYTKQDSALVVRLLKQAVGQKGPINYVIYFGKQLQGVPYVAKTLEIHKAEQVVINLRQLDCTTYVETVLALAQCAKLHKTKFEDFCFALRNIRYHDGNVAYTARKHYFTDWVTANSKQGFVKEVGKGTFPFTTVQIVKANYMSTHVSFYPMLVNQPERLAKIIAVEKQISGTQCYYIPKRDIRNTQAYRKAIHDGDIIAIVTNKKGLDTSHLGIAIWHKDGLHMLNASQIRGKVVEEPMTLRQYMSKHPIQIGIRIIRPL